MSPTLPDKQHLSPRTDYRRQQSESRSAETHIHINCLYGNTKTAKWHSGKLQFGGLLLTIEMDYGLGNAHAWRPDQRGPSTSTGTILQLSVKCMSEAYGTKTVDVVPVPNRDKQASCVEQKLILV